MLESMSDCLVSVHLVVITCSPQLWTNLSWNARGIYRLNSQLGDKTHAKKTCSSSSLALSSTMMLPFLFPTLPRILVSFCSVFKTLPASFSLRIKPITSLSSLLHSVGCQLLNLLPDCDGLLFHVALPTAPCTL